MILRTLVLASVMAAATTPAYRGEVMLPQELYTPAGTPLLAQKYQIEILRDGNQYQLVFLDKEKPVGTIPGRSPSKEEAFTVPIMGVAVLWPADSNDKEEPKSKLSPYLTNISWQAVLRVYRSRESSDHEVHALLRVKDETVQFPLYLEKPSPSSASR